MARAICNKPVPDVGVVAKRCVTIVIVRGLLVLHAAGPIWLSIFRLPMTDVYDKPHRTVSTALHVCVPV